ncbi:MAG TPA: ATP phosphoribosyltransferase regulatory subunit, partial [Candidatus Paceibacterota bacterium]
PLALPHITAADVANGKRISECEIVVDGDLHEEGASVRLEEKLALLRLYDEQKMASLPQPIQLFYKTPFAGDRRKPTGKVKESHYGLEILGTSKPMAEAILIQTALAILTDAGEKDMHVVVNSMGDKDSLARFSREITAYYKKHLPSLPQKCRDTVKRDVFALLGCDHEACKRLAEDCPKSINFLSERSREHFKELLEYLETLGVPYAITNTLVANRDYCDETIFEIRSSDPKRHPLAIGIRYDGLAKKVGHKKDLPAVGVSIAVPKRATKEAAVKKSVVTKILAPEICFMQLGVEAKQKSLRVMETLRQARIPVVQSLIKDKMAGQVGMAEKFATPVVLVMGKKEAMEDAVIVRDSDTRSQDTVLIVDVAAKLKKYKV